ncbi:MAG: ImmA/IrrE family metallo-endopeptidase [Bifidobacteriaceae bacterium]|jgi:Zn-dependent peptidase ImmA (M78 family)|nr:ImmA/IrrE family metallo-endopeptidase [Bifidobacteriaceae bacterium]
MKKMVTRVQVQPARLAWAADRAGKDEVALTARFSRYPAWVTGAAEPTFKQLEGFANYTHTPLGFLFLLEPPREDVPIPDYRRFGNAGVPRPSADLLETIYGRQTWQEWYREYARAEGFERPSWVGSVSVRIPPEQVANAISNSLGFDMDQRAKCPSHDAIRKYLIEAIEATGGLVMINGVVGMNTHRKLKPEEFRGFALCDPLAPLVFVNGAGTVGAQVFTLTHELAHLWADDTALSDASMTAKGGKEQESWANQVAAEALVPRHELAKAYFGQTSQREFEMLAARFKVSTLVILRRTFDLGKLTGDDYHAACSTEHQRILDLMAEQQTGGGGGDFYNTHVVWVGRAFARPVISDAAEGRTLFSDAFALLGTRKADTYDELARVVMA